MKILFVAPFPPPSHGLSVINRHLYEAWQKGALQDGTSLEIHFLDSALSRDLSEIGFFSLIKVFRLPLLLLKILQARLRFGPCALYYIPATGHATQILRDWFLLGLARPFFSHLILHWHGLGLKTYLEGKAPLWSKLSSFFLGHPDLSILLHEKHKSDVPWLRPKDTAIISNGIPDPCPDFEKSLLPLRLERLKQRQTSGPAPEKVFRILFLGHCTRDKGLFVALDALVLARETLQKQGSDLRLALSIAGQFFSDSEKKEFFSRLDHPSLKDLVDYRGFVEGYGKDRVMREHDCLCFPSFFPTEAQPVSIIEAMAYGMNLVVSDWRALPDILPPHEGIVVPVRDASALAEALLQSSSRCEAASVRSHFLGHFTIGSMIRNLQSAFLRLS